jgi:hypothetical protein
VQAAAGCNIVRETQDVCMRAEGWRQAAETTPRGPKEPRGIIELLYASAETVGIAVVKPCCVTTSRGATMNATVAMPMILAAVFAGAVSAQGPNSVRDSSPHSSAQVTVNGVTLHYLDWGGDGDVVLLLSGLGNDAHVFDHFATTLTDRWHVVGLTRRGFGESSKPATGYTTSIRVDDIRMFLDALKLDHVHLVGHSFAGDELTLLAARYPTRVNRLVYLEAAYDRSGSLKMALDDPTSSALNRRLTMEALGYPDAAAATSCHRQMCHPRGRQRHRGVSPCT